MAVLYRAEKKKILRSQIILVKKILHVLRNCEKVLTDSEESDTDKSKAFTELILKEHQLEKEKRKSIENDTKLTEEQRAEELSKEEEYFYYRRIINATYFKQIKTLILSGDFFWAPKISKDIIGLQKYDWATRTDPLKRILSTSKLKYSYLTD